MSNQQDLPPEELDETIAAAENQAMDDATLEDEDRLHDLTQEELALECRQAQEKAAENWDKLVRLQAEMENVRRRAERDVLGAHKYGSEKLIKELLPAIDSLERGLETSSGAGEDIKSVHEGMEMTLKLLLGALEKQGVKQVNPEGEPFNPAEMEAVSMQPNDKVDANTVLNVIQKGYVLNERLVRPAMVIVSQAYGLKFK